jgi:hypothetical protein
MYSLTKVMRPLRGLALSLFLWPTQALAELPPEAPQPVAALPVAATPVAAPPLAAGLDAALVSEPQIREEMHRYYTGERLGGVWLMSLGAPAVAIGTGLLFHPGEFQRGIGYPVLAVGAVELLAGVIFYVSSNRRVPRFDKQLGQSPADFRAQELRHLRGINRDMRLLEAFELTLMIASGTMTGIGTLRNDGTLAGVGTGLLIQSAVLFLYDQIASRRALRYTDSLTRFTVATVGDPGPAKSTSLAPRGALLTVMRQF